MELEEKSIYEHTNRTMWAKVRLKLAHTFVHTRFEYSNNEFRYYRSRIGGCEKLRRDKYEKRAEIAEFGSAGTIRGFPKPAPKSYR